jgi:uncharacterized protein (TIGR02466 family)
MAVVRDLNLFPVLVRRIDEFLTQGECAEIVAALDVSAFGPHGALIGNATSSFDHGFNKSRHAVDEVEKVVTVKDRILQQIETYAHDFGMRSVRLGNSWVNIQREGSRLDYHTHPLSIVSGVLYLKVDEASSKTTFCNPNPFIDVMVLREPTSYTTTTASLQPTVGSLVLFPSWLKHGSIDLNESPERVVLSFNTVFRPDSV